MRYQKLLQHMIGVTLVMLLLAGCGALAATPVVKAPAATPTPVPPTATPTSVPPTATPTPEPPTATPSIPAGTIRGILINAAIGESLPAGTVYPVLGQGMIEYDPNTDKFTGDYQLPLELYERLNKGIRLDGNGAFVISDVAPGTYFLVFRATEDGSIRRAFIAQDIIEVKVGEGVDLGKILVPTT